jgi:hypothetical protein
MMQPMEGEMERRYYFDLRRSCFQKIEAAMFIDGVDGPDSRVVLVSTISALISQYLRHFMIT